MLQEENWQKETKVQKNMLLKEEKEERLSLQHPMFPFVS